MSLMSFPVVASSLVLAGLLGACGAQSDEDYLGQSQLRLAGTVVNTLAVAPAAEVTILWTYDTGTGDFSVGQSVSVIGAFPAAFALDLFEPPVGLPAETFATIGLITAVSPTLAGTVDESDLLGIAEDHVLVYLARDVATLPAAERAQAVEIFGGELTAGFHLMAVTPSTDVFDDMTPIPSTAPITVRLGAAGSLDIPNVF